MVNTLNMILQISTILIVNVQKEMVVKSPFHTYLIDIHDFWQNSHN